MDSLINNTFGMGVVVLRIRFTWKKKMTSGQVNPTKGDVFDWSEKLIEFNF